MGSTQNNSDANKPSAATGTETAGNKRKRKEFAPYGNYRNYYGYRLANNMDEDPRFKIFRKDWFEGKDCLDIGCNNGLMTISIAKKFHCRTIRGIDIDSSRVKDADNHLRKEVSRGHHSRKPKLLVECENGKDEEHLTDIKVLGSSKKRTLSDIVSFRCENFALNKHPVQKEIYDTIVCLSVTKWVHLNWGDEGLIKSFAKMWDLLRPGGLLVLEPQPWKSYVSNYLVTETTAYHYKKIELFPRDFQDLLLDKIGFRFVEYANPKGPATVAGFNRPVLVFQK